MTKNYSIKIDCKITVTTEPKKESLSIASRRIFPPNKIKYKTTSPEMFKVPDPCHGCPVLHACPLIIRGDICKEPYNYSAKKQTESKIDDKAIKAMESWLNE